MTRLAVVHDIGKRMKNAAQPVTAEIAHHGATLFCLGIGLDGMTDIAGGGAGFNGGNAAHHRFIGDVYESLGLELDVADEIHAAGVAVPTVDDYRDIDV